MKNNYEHITDEELRHFYGSFWESVTTILIAWLFFGGLCYGLVWFIDFLISIL